MNHIYCLIGAIFIIILHSKLLYDIIFRLRFMRADKKTCMFGT